MQGNFLYDPATGRINLIDFGASKDYPLHFVTDYLHMVRACAERDRQEVVERSTRLGFLTGEERKGDFIWREEEGAVFAVLKGL